METFDKDKAREKYMIENPSYKPESDYYVRNSRPLKENILLKTFQVQEWRKRNPEKSRAQRSVFVAIRNKSLTRKPCKICGLEKSEAHHEDYSKPLEVIWLCKRHHAEADVLRRERLDK